jgi:DNA-binding IclR family transcriptional regulator
MSSIQSVRRAFSVLQSLSLGPASVSEIAERTKLPKSTVSRLLSTLVEVGAVEQSEPAGVYGLGELIVDLSSAASPGRNLIAIVRPYLVDLVVETGEAAGLGMLEGNAVYYYDQVDGDHAVQIRDWTGEKVDAHVVSSGLVLMAHASPQARSEFLAGPLKRWTKKSIIDPELVAARLDACRRDGAIWVCEEMSEGLNSVAAPIFNPAGAAIAAVHVHGPSYRFPESDRRDEIAEIVKAAARRITNRLAGRREQDG